MNQNFVSPPERQVIISHDGSQHCTAERRPDGNILYMDCPYTGKGAEFSPTNMIEAGLGGCMLLSMGTFALHSGLNVSGISMEVKVTMTELPRMRFKSILVNANMPPGLSAKDRKRLEGAAEQCPIKHSFSDDVPINVKYNYPD